MTALGVILGQTAGFFFGGGAGTAGLPDATYSAPIGGYTCMPSCKENDGIFFSMPSEGMSSFGGAKPIICLFVPEC